MDIYKVGSLGKLFSSPTHIKIVVFNDLRNADLRQ
jgi:hypothetical protein